MPNRSHSGILHSPWWWCDRCGLEYPVSALMPQRDLLVCRECWDNPIPWERDEIINDTLNDGIVDADVADILKEPPEDY